MASGFRTIWPAGFARRRRLITFASDVAHARSHRRLQIGIMPVD
jgi:hypothetical protein